MQLVQQDAKEFFKIAVRSDSSGHAYERFVPHGKSRRCEDFQIAVHSGTPPDQSDSSPCDARRATIDTRGQSELTEVALRGRCPREEATPAGCSDVQAAPLARSSAIALRRSNPFLRADTHLPTALAT